MLLEYIPVRLRLSLQHTAWMSILFLTVGFGLFKIVEHNLYDSVDAALLSSANAIKDVSRENGRSARTKFLDQILRNLGVQNAISSARLIRPFVKVINLSGRSTAPLPEGEIILPLTPESIERASLGLTTLETFTFRDGAYRQATLPVFENNQFSGKLVQVGASLGPTQGILNATALLLWLVLPLNFVISVILGYYLTARALTPVKRTAEAVANMKIDELTLRLPVPKARDEIQGLVLTFNVMFDRLEDAMKRLRRFSADVSHELRTPLAVVKGEAELALRKKRTPEEYERSLASVLREADHMAAIVDKLLLLAKAESGHVEESWEHLQTQEFTETLVRSVHPLFQQRGVRLDWICGGPETFMGSKTYLLLALKNMLLNAAKHSPQGGAVHFSVEEKQRSLVFTVTDEGEGIAPDEIPYIFDPFYRSDTARNRVEGGVGIGLSLTLALIKLHRGKISVHSELGKGTSFETTLPLYSGGGQTCG